MKTMNAMIASAAFASMFAANIATAAPNLVITEVTSKSAVTEDWFEITNFGDTAADITGWKFDDESADILDAVAITGVTSIAPGESVIILNDVDDTAFRAFWGGLAGVQIGFHDGAGLGKGDGITIFDAADSIALQLFYGDGDATDPSDLISDTHAGTWAGGEEWDSANYTPGGFVGGAAYDGQFGIYASSETNSESVYEFASPGTAVPEPATLALLGLGGFVALSRRG